MVVTVLLMLSLNSQDGGFRIDRLESLLTEVGASIGLDTLWTCRMVLKNCMRIYRSLKLILLWWKYYLKLCMEDCLSAAFLTRKLLNIYGMWLSQSMRQPLEDPAVLNNKPAEKEETRVERDSRSLMKRLLTFGLTDQVCVYLFWFPLVVPQHFLICELSIRSCNIAHHF